VGLRAGLDTDTREKILSPLPGIELRSHGRRVHSQTLLTELHRFPQCCLVQISFNGNRSCGDRIVI
jgi:hypothetical protein